MSLSSLADQGSSILVIEDDVLVAELIINKLEEDGYGVEHAPTVDEAMRLLSSQPFSLVMCDISLPGMMDGLSLAKALRLSNPTIPILVMTGYGDKATDAAQDFIVLKKPFGLPELGRIVAWALRDGGSPYFGATGQDAHDLH